MKNLLIVILFSVFSATIAQVDMEKVLVEMGTATWSLECATELAILEQMEAQGLNFSVINYHLNDPFANQAANIRASYYNMQAVPHPVIGGFSVIPGDYDSYLAAYHQSNGQSSSFTLSSMGHFEDDTLVLNISVDKIFDYESDAISLYIAFTESDIAFDWQGQNVVHHVERTLAPSASGIDLDFSSSNSIEIEERILFDRNWDPANMNLLIFIQNDTSKSILQTQSKLITHFAPLPVHAFFQVEDTMICAESTLQFENHSTGDIEYLRWFFEGGTPEESSDPQPVVYYEEEGIFDVKLVLSNSISNDTNHIDDYIHVKPLPEMTFNLLPEFCHNHIAYELTEGQPEGGQYYGSFVDTGYFHPQSAGIGTHTLFYQYQNPQTLCGDTITQDALVFLCESIQDPIPFDTQNPINISNTGRTIHLSISPFSNIEFKDIQVFNLEGKLLYSSSQFPNSKKNIKFRLNQYNPIILVHVLSNKNLHTFKYKMD